MQTQGICSLELHADDQSPDHPTTTSAGGDATAPTTSAGGDATAVRMSRSVSVAEVASQQTHAMKGGQAAGRQAVDGPPRPFPHRRRSGATTFLMSPFFGYSPQELAAILSWHMAWHRQVGYMRFIYAA